MGNLVGSNSREIAFQGAEVTQLRANHQRVPPKVRGWGLSKSAIALGAPYWIFGPPRIPREKFYWMHTNVICEIEEGQSYVEFETASGSIYRVDFFEGKRPSWISDELENAMVKCIQDFERDL